MKEIFKINLDNKRVYGLDILRSFAILFVLIEHGKYMLPQTAKNICDFFIFDGVTIFFVLSGFLIGGILINLIEKNGLTILTLKTFWIKRWYRTLPNYFFILIILCFLNLIFEKDFTLRSINRFFIFSQNIFDKHPSWFFPEAWSLSIEEWFYIILPLGVSFFFIVTKSYKRSILYISLFIILIITSYRFYKFSNVQINDINDWDFIFRKQVSTRLDSLIFGVFGAYINIYYNKIWTNRKRTLMVIGIVLFIIIKFIPPLFFEIDHAYFSVFSFSLNSIATLLVLPFLSNYKSGKGLTYKILTYISLISYSMYLLNLSIIQGWIISKISWDSFIENKYILTSSKYISYWLLVVSLSILNYKYFEIPITSLRNRFKS